MAARSLFPLFLNLDARPVLVVGAGTVARRKVGGLLDAGASVTVVSPAFDDSFSSVANIEKIAGAYDSAMLTQKRWTLVFAATNVPAVNRQVQGDAAAAGILCCRCDEHGDADFLGAASFAMGGVTVALTTAGASPALARRIRDQLRAGIDPVLAQLAELLHQWRPEVKTRISDAARRRELLLRLAGSEMENRLRSDGPTAAAELFRQWIADSLASPRPANDLRPVDHAG